MPSKKTIINIKNSVRQRKQNDKKQFIIVMENIFLQGLKIPTCAYASF